MDEIPGTLKGRTALVTGGLSGIGRASAERLAGLGANIVVLSLAEGAVQGESRHFEPSDSASSVGEHVNASGGTFELVEGDCASSEAIERAVAAAQPLGGVDLLVNCAASNAPIPIVDVDEALWRRVLDVNLVGPFLAIRACLPGMMERNFGRIVSIGSRAAHSASAAQSAYVTSKHGLLGLHKAVAAEVVGYDITANTVSPGFVQTPSSMKHLASVADERGVDVSVVLDEMMAALPQKRFPDTSEFAEVVAFLCASAPRVVNGTDILATGAGD